MADSAPMSTGAGETTPEDRLAEFLLLEDRSPEAFSEWVRDQPHPAAELEEAYESWKRGAAGLDLAPRGAGNPVIRPGTRLDRYLLVHELGHGAQGTVWEAEDTTLGRRVALKCIPPDRLSERSIEMLSREARAAGQLTHEGIVRVHELGSAGGIHWIAQELVPQGRTLFDFLEEQREGGGELPAAYYREVARMCAEAAEALQAAHEAGVFHQDIKPLNLLLLPGDRVKVGDFGLARATEESRLSTQSQVLGTYFYMSPEQARGDSSQVDARTDIFSLGSVLYELLTLRRPFEGDTPVQVTARILDADPPDPRTLRSLVPSDLATIAGKALEKARSRRYATMADLAADLRAFLDGQPISARPPTRTQKALRFLGRHPTATAIGAVGLVATLAISVLIARSLRDASSIRRLSAIHEHAELLERAEALWPPFPEHIRAFREWIEDATNVAETLPVHLRVQQRLAERAAPSQEGEPSWSSARDRFDYERLEAEIQTREIALARRTGGAVPNLDPVEPDWASLTGNAEALLEMSWQIVGPANARLGRERLGLALLARAEEKFIAADRTDRFAFVNDTRAWGLHRLGEDERAIETAREFLDSFPAAHASLLRQSFERLVASVEAATSAHGLEVAREELAALRERRTRLIEASRPAPDFPPAASVDAWWFALVGELIGSIADLTDPETGLLSQRLDASHPLHGWSIPRRLSFAADLADRFQPSGEYGSRWRSALPALRERYGFDVPPQMGLVPIGPDPRSGLWEFWVVGSGEEPKRTEDGELHLMDDTGLILVLLPGGTCSIGASKNEASQQYWEGAKGPEGPVHPVRLSPFFISKFEMTQAQWEHLHGTNPSSYGADGELATPRHPVEGVSWNEGQELLRRFGLELPTDAQWEYAARAGTRTPWWSGQDRESLVTSNAGNFRDRTLLEGLGQDPSSSPWPEFTDGQAVHAPVGTFAPNPFGLHDVHGNVSELCRDGYHDKWYWMAEAWAPDPFYPGGENRVRRGGSHVDWYYQCTSSRREPVDPTTTSWSTGLRPARKLTK